MAAIGNMLCNEMSKFMFKPKGQSDIFSNNMYMAITRRSITL